MRSILSRLALAVSLFAVDCGVANATSTLVLNARNWRVSKNGNIHRVVSVERGRETKQLELDTSVMTIRIKNSLNPSAGLSYPVVIVPSNTDPSKVGVSWSIEFNPSLKQSMLSLKLTQTDSPRFKGQVWVHGGGILQGSVSLDREIKSAQGRNIRLLEIRDVELPANAEPWLVSQGPLEEGDDDHPVQKCAKLPPVVGSFETKFAGKFANFGLFGYRVGDPPPQQIVSVSLLGGTPSLISGQIRNKGQSRKYLTIWASPTSGLASYSFSVIAGSTQCHYFVPLTAW